MKSIVKLLEDAQSCLDLASAEITVALQQKPPVKELLRLTGLLAAVLMLQSSSRNVTSLAQSKL